MANSTWSAIPREQMRVAGLQAIYAAQTWSVLPAALLSALLLNAAIKRDEVAMKDRISAIAAGWRIGTQAKLLLGYPWNDRFTWQLSECRKEMNVVVEATGPGIAPSLRAAA